MTHAKISNTKTVGSELQDTDSFISLFMSIKPPSYQYKYTYFGSVANTLISIFLNIKIQVVR